MFWGATLTFAVVVIAIAGLWWRLSSGPIELDMATPWLKAACLLFFVGYGTKMGLAPLHTWLPVPALRPVLTPDKPSTTATAASQNCA